MFPIIISPSSVLRQITEQPDPHQFHEIWNGARHQCADGFIGDAITRDGETRCDRCNEIYCAVCDEGVQR